MGGQLARLLLQFAGIVILARLLTPRDYGLLAMVMAIIGVGELLRDLGLSTASIQAGSVTKWQRDNLFWINSGIGLALSAGAFLSAGTIAAFYGEPLLERIVQALSPTFLVNGLGAQYRADLTRRLRLTHLAIITVAALCLGLASGIALAYAGAGYWALVAYQLVNSSATLVLSMLAAGWLPGRVHRAANMTPFLRFGWNLLGVQLITYLSRNLSSILIGNRFGADTLGLYDRAFQLLMLPLNQINAPATTVALPFLSRLQNDRERFALFLLHGQTVLIHLTISIFSFACAQAEPLILLTLGEQWRETIPLFQILTVAGVFQAASYATAWVFLAKGLMSSNLKFSVASRALLIAIVFLGLPWGVEGVAAGYSAGLAAMWPLGLWWIGRHSDAPALAMLGNGTRAIVGYAVCGLASYSASHLLGSSSQIASLGAGMAGMLAGFLTACAIWPAFRRDVAAIARTRALLRREKTGSPPGA